MYVPDVIIHHYHGASSGIKKSSRNVTKATYETKTRSIKSGVQAMKIFYEKYYKDKYPKIMTRLILLIISLMGILRLAKVRFLS
jgi:hypothetical protein